MKNPILDLSFHIRQKDKKIRQITDQTRRERRNENTPSKSHKANLQKLMSIISNLPKSQQDEYNKLKSLADDSPGPRENMLSRLERVRNLSVNSRPCKTISEIPYKKHVELLEYQYSLFISDANTANDFVQLQKYNINAVLTFGQRNDPSKFTVLKGGYLCIDLEDSSKDLICSLARICKFIDLNIVKGNILVHCCEGNSWSCAATAGYLVKKYKMTLDKALAVVKEGRPSLQLSKTLERMSVNYNAFHQDSHPNPRIRRELEKFHHSLPGRASFSFNPLSSALALDFIAWNELSGVEYSENSSCPQFFCQFGASEALIVRGSSNVVTDIFTSSLQSTLNIHTQKQRLVQFTQGEFKQIIDNLQRVAIGDRYLESAILRELDRPFLLVLEYKPCTYFLQMDKNSAKQFFAQDARMGFRRCREIGEIIAVDILLNNDARVPVLWDSDGNPSCFLLSLDAQEDPSLEAEDFSFSNVFAIDNQIKTFQGEDSELLKSQYLEKVERYIRATVRDLDDALAGRAFSLLSLSSLERIKDFFYKCTGVELDNFQQFQVLKGMMGTFKEISDMENEELEDILQELKTSVDEDWMETWARGLESLPLGFIVSTKSVISKIVQSNESSFRWVFQMYKIDDSPLFF